jgi:hypothetical protein
MHQVVARLDAHAPLEPGGRPAFWLERLGPHTLLDAMVLDRAAFAAREVLHHGSAWVVPVTWATAAGTRSNSCG